MLIVPLTAVRSEYSVSNSRFISCLSPVLSIEEGRQFISCCRQEFSDATHHVPAFIIGGGNNISEFCSDDGEPSGTAGRPLLTVLKGSGLANVAVVVVRYFGGTQLGTGGLVKAYSAAGQQVLALVKRAKLVASHRVSIELPYQFYDRTKQECSALKAIIIKEVFLDTIQMQIQIATDDFETFCQQLAEISAGSLHAKIIDTYNSPIPL